MNWRKLVSGAKRLALTTIVASLIGSANVKAQSTSPSTTPLAALKNTIQLAQARGTTPSYKLPDQTPAERSMVRDMGSIDALLIYTVHDNGEKLFVMSFDGSEPIHASESIKSRVQGAHSFKFSPNGNLISFIHNGDIFKQDVASDKISRVTTNSEIDDYCWMNDSKLVFISGGDSIKSVGKTGANLKEVRSTNYDKFSEIKASPDGKYVVYKNIVGPLALLDKEYVISNLKDRVSIKFKNERGRYSIAPYDYRSGPDDVSWAANDEIIFTFQHRDKNYEEVYGATLATNNADFFTGKLNKIKKHTLDEDASSSPAGILLADGSFSVYVSSKGGTPDIYAQRVKGGTVINARLTNSSARESDLELRKSDLSRVEEVGSRTPAVASAPIVP